MDNDNIAQTVADNGITQMPTFAFLRGHSRVSQFSGADKRTLENNGELVN